jgi:hypothetical protein
VRGFTAEAFKIDSVPGERVRQGLQSHSAAKFEILGTIHNAYSAADLLWARVDGDGIK